jgi:prepilin-type processing-associated H-X9-DG protein
MLIMPYVKNVEVYNCPSASSDIKFNPPTSANPRSCSDGTYGINRTYFGGSQYTAQKATFPVAKPLCVIEIPADTLLLADGGSGYQIFWSNISGNDGPTVSTDTNPPLLGAPMRRPRFAVNGRHSGGAAFIFCDGHAKWMKLEQAARKNRNDIMYYFTTEDDANL